MLGAKEGDLKVSEHGSVADERVMQANDRREGNDGQRVRSRPNSEPLKHHRLAQIQTSIKEAEDEVSGGVRRAQPWGLQSGRRRQGTKTGYAKRTEGREHGPKEAHVGVGKAGRVWRGGQRGQERLDKGWGGSGADGCRNLDGKQEWEGIGETRGRCNGARAHRAKAQGRDVLGGRG
jgi:hypothetical protein